MLRLVIEDEVPGPPAVPGPRECVVCFVDRMTRAYGCNGRLLWAERWQADRAPRATALAERLGRKGGFCDCEVLMNAYVRRELLMARITGSWTNEDTDFEEREPPPCAGVRLGSTQGCRHWIARRRGTW